MTEIVKDIAIKCEICSGKYTSTNKAHHLKTKKHRTEEAKAHNEFDYINYKIINKASNNEQIHEQPEKIKHVPTDKQLLKDNYNCSYILFIFYNLFTKKLL